jgi:hypothetical protein
MIKIQRAVENNFLNSGMDTDSTQNNPASGGQKSLIVGPRYLPIPIVSGGVPSWTTDASVAPVGLPNFGMILAVYNKSGTAASITVGANNSITSQAIGAVDASGNVGVACAANAYTYISPGYNKWIITSSNNLVVYIMEDPTYFVQQSGPYSQQNAGNTQPIS